MSVLENPTDLMVSTQAKATGNVIHVLEVFQKGEAETQLGYELEWSNRLLSLPGTDSYL